MTGREAIWVKTMGAAVPETVAVAEAVVCLTAGVATAVEMTDVLGVDLMAAAVAAAVPAVPALAIEVAIETTVAVVAAMTAAGTRADTAAGVAAGPIVNTVPVAAPSEAEVDATEVAVAPAAAAAAAAAVAEVETTGAVEEDLQGISLAAAEEDPWVLWTGRAGAPTCEGLHSWGGAAAAPAASEGAAAAVAARVDLLYQGACHLSEEPAAWETSDRRVLVARQIDLMLTRTP